MYTLNVALSKKNNFDALRLFASVGVVLSHSSILTQGSHHNEIVYLLSGGKVTLGDVCVMVFFVISGFLITGSFARSPSVIDYLTNRIIRIFPALAVVVLITSMAVGPIITLGTTNEYWLSDLTYRYLQNILMYPAAHPTAQQLPGIFETNPIPSNVNGSLWTLSYEFSCYLAVAAIGFIFKRSWLPAILMLLFTAGTVFYINPIMFVKLFGYFLAGSLFYVLRKYIIIDRRLFLISILMLVAALLLKFNFRLAFYIFGTYSILYLACSDRLRMHGFARYGDFSYGVYIYAFPIQQIFVPYTTSAIGNFLASMPIILICAICSWYVVEKPALSRKRQISALIRGRFNWQATKSKVT